MRFGLKDYGIIEHYSGANNSAGSFHVSCALLPAAGGATDEHVGSEIVSGQRLNTNPSRL